MGTLQGLATGASYGAFVAASSMTFAGVNHTAYLIATGKAADASTIFALWVIGAGCAAAIVGTMIGGLLGALLGATGAERAASPLSCVVVLIITAASISLAQGEAAIVTYFLLPVVGLATGLMAWWAGRRFASVLQLDRSPLPWQCSGSAHPVGTHCRTHVSQRRPQVDVSLVETDRAPQEV